ncbi:unnamed protein product [Pylaiella littoralis]
MVVLQARSLGFGLRSTLVNDMFAANPPGFLWVPPRPSIVSLRQNFRTARTSPATSTTGRSLQAAGASSSRPGISSSSRGSCGRAHRIRRGWWGMALNSKSTLGTAAVAHNKAQPVVLPQLHRRQQQPLGSFLTSTGTRLMSTSKSDGAEGTRQEGEEEEGDGLLASLADELVWKGDDGEEDDEEGEDGLEFESLDASELESLGISMLDDENAEEVQEQLRREWGAVSVENEQNEYGIDTAELQSKLSQAMVVLGCQAWDVAAVLTTDKEVSRLNRQYRGMTTSTDILSFPNHDMSGNPGVLPEVRFPAEMDLGDMFISLPYVDRQIKRDEEETAAAVASARGAAEEEGGAEEEQEWWDSERGVSGAMSRVFDVQERASMLLVHGLIHLLGYDHEKEQDYEAMVAVEEEVLQAVFRKGVARGPPPSRSNASS